MTEPHYSIRLPGRLQEMAKTLTEIERFVPSTIVYYVGSQCGFLFTAQIKSQPRGTDASNIFDEEITNADEIEFSDDEAEAAYVRSCRNAKKAAAMERKQANNRSQSGASLPSNPDLLISAGKHMIEKRPSDVLNYNEEDGDMAESDYSVLERPKGGLDYTGAPPSSSLAIPPSHADDAAPSRATSKQGVDSRARNNKSRGTPRGTSRGRGRGGRGRGGRLNTSVEQRERTSASESSPSDPLQSVSRAVGNLCASTAPAQSHHAAPAPLLGSSNAFQYPLAGNGSGSFSPYVPQAHPGFGAYNPNTPAMLSFGANGAPIFGPPLGASNANGSNFSFAPSLPNISPIPQYQPHQSYNMMSHPIPSSPANSFHSQQMQSFSSQVPHHFQSLGFQPIPQSTFSPYYLQSALSTDHLHQVQRSTAFAENPGQSFSSSNAPRQIPGDRTHYNPRFFPPPPPAPQE